MSKHFFNGGYKRFKIASFTIYPDLCVLISRVNYHSLDRDIMTQGSNKLERLVNLASETGSDQRRQLLSEITSVFLEDTNSYSDVENQFFGEIMGKVAFDLEKEVRQELAKSLATEASAPRDLIMRLAHDEISVAKPIIEKSPVLNDDDLVEKFVVCFPQIHRLHALRHG